ncbi:MAG: response regulator transcription factor [Deltaproteobacteria bacterium]|jgi:DNA-binding response OmpR family regulator|nr:response regulator transcription factor [Deltaproteobacteria bacterium]
MNGNPEAKILLVDDAARLRSRLEDFLESHNFAIKSLPDGREAGAAISEFQPDLLLLDVMLPGLDGFEVLRCLRLYSSLPVIMLTACNNRGDRVNGLELGADDYLGKPFHLGELLARIRAVLRRVKPQNGQPSVTDETPLESEELTSGPLVLDIGRQRLALRGKTVEVAQNLTNLEFRLFYLFFSHPEVVLNRDEVLESLFDSRTAIQGQSLRVYVNRARKILTELGLDPQTVATVWGSGYRWSPPPYAP